MKQTFTGPDGIYSGYLYDQSNQLTGVQVPNLGFISINDYTWNRPASMTLPGGTTREFEYDPLMRIKKITSKDPGQNVMLNYKYDYDKMDNIKAKATEYGAYTYGYDDLYRLTTADNPVQEDEGFTYDMVGNRLTAANTTGDWAYNDNNELLSSSALTGQPDQAIFEYDANGNTIRKTVGSVVASYVYNLEDRLTQIWNGEVSTGSLTAEYYYDPFGRRLWKEVSGVRTYFHYADEGLTAEMDSAGTITKTYGYKPGSTWTTDPLFMKVGTEYYFYHTDHLGTPQKMTSTNGAVVWSAKYSSFGEANVEIGTIENNLRFPGQYYDGESGLHYNWFRHYYPQIGRFTQGDQLGFIGGDLNLYSYVWNNPTNLIDKYGLWGEDVHSGNPDSDYGTYSWAKQAGFNDRGAELIATGNQSVDWWWGSSPLTGNQGRHFNESADGCDSRLYYAKRELKNAIRLFGEGKEAEALGRLGMGLHSLQDFYAHKDWDTGILRSIPHPPSYDWWNFELNAEAKRLTKEATMNYLKEFKRLTYDGYTH
ncbi:MAG: RHS repeat-associated core domain-containing protein [Desulfobacteraceae bacterium]|nr:RHS repeat-associated core domain-containing protein [Desulfobacteraceae bacterium]